MADVLTTERTKVEETTKFERKLIKEIRSMLDEHKARNVALYRLSLLTQKRRLQLALLRKLEAQKAQRELEAANAKSQ